MIKEFRHIAARALRKAASIVDDPSLRTKDISAEDVNWLSFAVPGMQDRGNLYLFDHAVRHLPSEAPIIEIGSFSGLSTNLISYFKRKNLRKNPLFSCDKWVFEGSERGPTLGEFPITHKEYRSFVRDNFLRSTSLFSREDLPHAVEMTSDEFFDAWRKGQEVNDVFGRSVKLGGPMSFCFIDGNHSYDFVKRDFLNCDEYLDHKGYLLFDDSADLSGWEVYRLMPEIQRSGRYDLVAKNPNYLFQRR
jgi:hypothetical protein